MFWRRKPLPSSGCTAKFTAQGPFENLQTWADEEPIVYSWLTIAHKTAEPLSTTPFLSTRWT